MGGESPPGRNERPDKFEVGWPDAKAYGRRLDTDGPAAAAANRCRWDETPGRCEGGRIAPCRSDEIRLVSTSSLDRDESESTRDWGAPAPHRKTSRSPGEWQPISSPNPAVGDRWWLAYEGGGFVWDRRRGEPVNWVNKVRKITP